MDKEVLLAPSGSNLRDRAGKRVSLVSNPNIAEMSPEDIAVLIHELETHQIELEMQNEELLRVQNEVVEARDQYTELYDFAPVGYVTVSMNGFILQANLTLSKMLGVTRTQLFDQSFTSFVFKEDQDNYYQYRKALIAALEGHSCELRLRNSSGDVFWASLNSVCVRSPDGEDFEIRSILLDINERKRSEAQIRTLSQAVEQSPVSVVLTDPDSNIEYVNSTFEELTGFSAAEVVGNKPTMLQSGKASRHSYANLWRDSRSDKPWQGEFQNRRKNGEIFWEHAHIAPVVDDAGTIRHFLAVKEDITLRKQHEEQIEYQANYDALTGLANRFLTLDRLAELITRVGRSKETVAVLFLDMDDFKKINDTLGHETGDKVLVQASTRLRNALRAGDTVGRLGGDEFIVLLNGLTDVADVIPAAEHILAQFREAFSIDGRQLVITVSIGIATYPLDGSSPSELLRKADSAMYNSKILSRNTYSFYTDAMNQEVSRRLLLEEHMNGALERNEFRVCYQPVVAIDSNRIVGFEALLRWHNPALGGVSPAEFIPIAEQIGKIEAIGEYVLVQSINQLATWQQQYKQAFTMAINLSPRQFRDSKLVTRVAETIKQAGVTSDSLEIEITEGVMISGHAYVVDVLRALSELGVNIAMDDFGTGYSSLSYLRSYPFNTLKIDRSFVNDITVDCSGRKLVNAIIAMARSLGLKVIAEGVETEEQLALLASQHCEFAQGYLFSQPLWPEEMSELLDA